MNNKSNNSERETIELLMIVSLLFNDSKSNDENIKDLKEVCKEYLKKEKIK